jgi:hypothetical protein
MMGMTKTMMIFRKPSPLKIYNEKLRQPKEVPAVVGGTMFVGKSYGGFRRHNG